MPNHEPKIADYKGIIPAISCPFTAHHRILRHELGPHYREDLTEAFLRFGPDAIEELQKDTEVVYDYVRWPDYHADQVGGVREGRTLEPRRYDGRKLGKADFELLRPPIRRLMLLGGMSIDKRKVDDFLNPFGSVKGL